MLQTIAYDEVTQYVRGGEPGLSHTNISIALRVYYLLFKFQANEQVYSLLTDNLKI